MPSKKMGGISASEFVECTHTQHCLYIELRKLDSIKERKNQVMWRMSCNFTRQNHAIC